MMEVWLILLYGGLLFFVVLTLLLVLYNRGYMQRLPAWTGLGYGKDPKRGLKDYDKVLIAVETQEAQTKKHIVTHELQPGKTLWDWLQLLIVPVVLAIVAFSFNAGQVSMNQRLEQQRRQEQIVDAYLDRMSNLLLAYNLRDSKPSAPVRATAQAITLTTLDRLDPAYKKIIILFLYRADLNTYHFEFEDKLPPQQKAKVKDKVLPIINLPWAHMEGVAIEGAYLSAIDLHNAYLSRANFHKSRLERAQLEASSGDHVNLSNARMRAADLSNIDLTDANLQGTILQDANMPRANLTNADLTGANLTNANLAGANLYRAKVSSEQLAKAMSLAGAIMPDGIRHS